MIKIALVLIAIAALSLGSYANSVSVSTVTKSTLQGSLTDAYFENSAAGTSSTPSVDTTRTAPGGTGTYTIAKGSTDWFWSPQFPTAKNIPAGEWVLTIYGFGSKSGTMTASIMITNSAGVTQTTILAATSTPTIGTSQTMVVMTANAAATSVPANGYICVTLLAPNGPVATWTISWGSGQLSSLQVPMGVATG